MNSPIQQNGGFQPNTTTASLQFRKHSYNNEPSSPGTNAGNESAVKVTISQEGLSQSRFISSAPVNLDAFMEEIRANEIDKISSSIIGEEDARNLFSLLNDLDKEQLSDLYKMLEDPSINKTDLLLALATAKDSAGDMLGVMSKLNPEERDSFLALAAKVDSESSSALVKIAERAGNTDLHRDFLTLAKELDGEDLSNFIKAGADNPNSMAGLVKMTGELSKTDRGNFLEAAADSPNLGLLISNSQNLDIDKRSDFLFAAAKSGKALKELVGLSTRLSGKEFQRDILSMASMLSQDEFDNYLRASINSGDKTQALHELTNGLQGSQRSSFLKIAAGAGLNTSELIDQVSGFAQNSADLHNFLAAASRTSEIGELLSLTRQAGDKRSGFLELVGALSTADLQNFYFGAGEMSSSTQTEFIDQAGQLSGIERSHFLFGASKVGDHQGDYIDLVGKLDGEERTGMLLVIANGNSEETPSMIKGIMNMAAGDQRAESIADARLSVILSESKPMASDYVHLSNFLDADEYNDFLMAVDYPGNEDEAERLLEASETVSDRSSFLAAAADSKEELSHLLDMGEKLSGETRETFMAVVGNLRGENIRNFVSVAFDSNENLDEFLKLTDELTGQEKDDFLKASVDAQEQRGLKEFIGLSNELTGPNRSLFLNVAETAGKQLGNLIQGTNNYISSQEKLFMANAKAQGFDLHNMFKFDKNDPTKVDSIAGIKSGYLPNFLENASASKHLVGSYLKSYIS